MPTYTIFMPMGDEVGDILVMGRLVSRVQMILEVMKRAPFSACLPALASHSFIYQGHSVEESLKQRIPKKVCLG